MNGTEQSITTDLVAGILAGGQSVRMGSPKGLLHLPNDRSLIEHVYSTVQPLASEVVILGDSFDLPSPLQHLKVLPDEMEQGGPLAGLCTLLDYADRRWALLVACDMPRVSCALLQRLLSNCTPEAQAVVYRDVQQPDIFQACCGLYHPNTLPQARAVLADGRRSMQQLLARLNKVCLVPSAEQHRALTNINTPQDWNELPAD